MNKEKSSSSDITTTMKEHKKVGDLFPSVSLEGYAKGSRNENKNKGDDEDDCEGDIIDEDENNEDNDSNDEDNIENKEAERQ